MLKDIVDSLGPSYFMQQRKIEEFYSIIQVISSFCNHKCHCLRQAASFAIGVAAKKCPKEVFQTIESLSLEALLTAAKFQFPASQDSSDGSYALNRFLEAKDNAIAAIGKSLRY